MNQIFPPCVGAVNHEISFGHIVLKLYLRYPDRGADGQTAIYIHGSGAQSEATAEGHWHVNMTEKHGVE